MNEAYLCLGGNLGDCVKTFAQSIALLEEKGVKTLLRSAIFTSEAWGMDQAPDFYNQVIKVETKSSAEALLDVIFTIEKQLGRERNTVKRYESRTIDLDILFYNDEIIETERLHIPHLGLASRRFVLAPLAEIAPDLIHPRLKKTISQLLAECTDTGIVTRAADAF